jgi:hypothetical protein
LSFSLSCRKLMGFFKGFNASTARSYRDSFMPPTLWAMIQATERHRNWITAYDQSPVSLKAQKRGMNTKVGWPPSHGFEPDPKTDNYRQ